MKIVHKSNLQSEPISHDPDIMKTVLIRKGEVNNLIYLSQTEIPAGKATAKHSHDDMTEVFIITSGNGTLIIYEDEYSLSPGSCAIVEPGDSHVIRNDNTDPLQMTYFGISA